MVNSSNTRWENFFLSFSKNTNGYTWHDVKYILILCTIWCTLFLFDAPMKIKHINLLEALHSVLAHSPKSGIIKVAMIGDKGKNTIACSMNAPLSETNKFDIIILQP